ncbi:Twitching mobility protein [bioreactor metagenome]|uniref:Twitching mobility protein n=1 Tax=bioreactor metagenome TaxID=1076179 RepID=A0A645J6N2_9ZZZZ
MIPAFEVLMTTPAVRNTIREGKTFMIDNIIQTSGEMGMVSLDSYLAKLVIEGKISQDVATNFSSSPLDFNNRLRNKKIL